MGRAKKNKPRRVRPPMPTGTVFPPAGMSRVERRHPEMMGADRLEEDDLVLEDDDWGLEEDDWSFEDDDWVLDPELGEVLRARGWVETEPDNAWMWEPSESHGQVVLPTNLIVADTGYYVVCFATALGDDPSELILANFAEIIAELGRDGSWREMGFAGREALIGALEWIEAYRAGDPAPVGSGPFGSTWEPDNIEQLALLKESDPTNVADRIDPAE